MANLKKKPILKPALGFSLIELTIYLTILAVVFSFLFFAWHEFNKIYIQQKVSQEIYYSSLFLSEFLFKSISGAKTILEPAVGSSSSNLRFIPQEGTDEIIIRQEKDNLFLESNSQKEKLHSDRVRIFSISFSNFSQNGNPSSISIEATLKYKNPLYLPVFDISFPLYLTANSRFVAP